VALIRKSFIRRTLAASASNSSGSNGNGSKDIKTDELKLTIINSSYEKKILLWKKDRLEEELSIVNKYLKCYPEEKGEKSKDPLKVAYYKEAVLVTGAFDIKDELKDLGGRYNRQLKGWVFSKKKRDAVVKLVKESLPAGVDMVDETVSEDDAEQETLALQFDIFSEGCPVDNDTVYWTDGLSITRTRKDGTPDGYYYSTVDE